jgi:hypothetical protein
MVGDRDAKGIRGVGLGRLPDHCPRSPLKSHDAHSILDTVNISCADFPISSYSLPHFGHFVVIFTIIQFILIPPPASHLVLYDLSSLVRDRVLGFFWLYFNDGLAGIVPEEFE